MGRIIFQKLRKRLETLENELRRSKLKYARVRVKTDSTAEVPLPNLLIESRGKKGMDALQCALLEHRSVARKLRVPRLRGGRRTTKTVHP